MNLTYKEIDIKDKDQLKNLVNIIMTNLANKQFFIPFEDQEYDDMFNKNIMTSVGAYDGNILVGISQLYIDENYLKELKQLLNINSKVCEVGYMVLPEYRNNKIAQKMVYMLVKKAKELNIEYISAMAHPDNIASIKVIEKFGLKYRMNKLLDNGFLRNIYYARVSEVKKL